MYITGKVDLPQAVLDAHEAGRLVLFVGAGVSVDPPTNLPLFPELAKRVADEFPRYASVVDLTKDPDRLLGELARVGVPVHHVVAEIINDPESQPNANHHALVRIAAARPGLRIVTTNFDDHLASAASSNTMAFDQYVSPALPLGASFTGLVHLHGSASKRPHEMILTDQDFGTAYLADAWATRFLYSMFQEFVVLYVGYSHNDVMMDYLGIGLRRRDSRFVLTDEPEQPKWARLGITPVAYPSDGADHVELTEALEGWATLVTEGALARHARVKEIVSAPPSADRAELDYVARAIRFTDGAEAFRRFADPEAWMDWLVSTEAFTPNWTGLTPEGTTYHLAFWFADHALTGPAAESIALNILMNRPKWSVHLWICLATATQRLAEGSDDKRFERWVAVLLSQAVDLFEVHDYVVMLLEAASWDRHPSATVLLWRAAFQVRMKLRPRFMLEPAASTAVSPSADLEWVVPENWTSTLTEALSRLTNGTAAPELLAVAEDAMSTAYALQRADSRKGSSFDAISFKRSAIEPHEQDSWPDGAHLVIDVMRDGLGWLAEHDPQRAQATVDRWLADDRAVFARLGLWGLTKLNHDPDSQLRALLTSGLLFTLGFRHEVFTLLAAAMPEASPEAANRLLDAIELAELDPEFADHNRFEMLHWLTRHRDSWPEAEAMLANIEERHPEWMPSDHPDFDHFLTGGIRPSLPPFADDEFQSMLDEDPRRAVRALLDFDYGDVWTQRPTWDDGITGLRRAVSTNPQAGVAAWDAIKAVSDTARRNDLLESVLAGWARPDDDAVDSGDMPWAQVLGLLDDGIAMDEHVHAIANLLLAGVRGPNPMPAPCFGLALDLSMRLWTTRLSTYSPWTGVDAATEALNGWPGILTNFWIHLASQLRQADGDPDAPSVGSALRDIEGMLEGIAADSLVSLAGPRAAIGGELAFLFGAFPDVIAGQVFPVMAEHDEVARQFWEGYLYHPRVNLGMIERGFADTLLRFAPVAHRLPGRLNDQFLSVALAIAHAKHHAREDPVAYLTALSRAIEPESAASLISALDRSLDREDTSANDRAWDEWLGTFIDLLGSGRAVRVNPSDWCECGALVVSMDERFPAAVQTFVKYPARLGQHSHVLYRLKQSNHPEQHPEACIALLLHLLQDVAQLSWHGHFLGELALRLRASARVERFRELVEAALKANVSAAASWLGD